MDQIDVRMKKYLFLLFLIYPLIATAQEEPVTSGRDCAPIINGKVCYIKEVDMKGSTQKMLFNAINEWAKQTYGKDVFSSNVSSNISKGTILTSSKVEMVLTKSEKTFVRYKMFITCDDYKYTVEIKDIRYQYDPTNEKRFKNYTAEELFSDKVKENVISTVKNLDLFCTVTQSLVESLLDDVYKAAGGVELNQAAN